MPWPAGFLVTTVALVLNWALTGSAIRALSNNDDVNAHSVPLEPLAWHCMFCWPFASISQPKSNSSVDTFFKALGFLSCGSSWDSSASHKSSMDSVMRTSAMMSFILSRSSMLKCLSLEANKRGINARPRQCTNATLTCLAKNSAHSPVDLLPLTSCGLLPASASRALSSFRWFKMPSGALDSIALSNDSMASRLLQHTALALVSDT